MRQTIREIMTHLSPFDDVERIHQTEVLKWIDSKEELCRLKKPATPPKHLVSYCLIIDIEKQQLLLGDHIKAELWLPPGGHVEPNEHPLETAKRELKEELAIELPLLQLTPLFLTVAKTVGMTARHTDVSLWYVFKTDSKLRYQFDPSEFNAMKWFQIDNLPLDRTDPHMARFCNRLLHFLEALAC